MGGNGTYNLVNHADHQQMCSDNCRLLSLQILQEAVTSPGVMGADPGAAPLTLISHNGQDTGQLFDTKMPDLGGAARLVREKRIREA